MTDAGRKRRHNEDNLLVLPLDGSFAPATGEVSTLWVEPPGLLLAVADGMGGHHGGEVASRVCVENLVKEIGLRLQPSATEDWSSALRESVEATHHSVFAFARGYAEKQTMGTTLTAALIVGSRVEVAQVGDSRAYLFRSGNLILLTQDQTIGNQLRSRGQDPGMVNPQIAELLTQAVGAQAEIHVVMSAVDVGLDDLLLLCSDGLYKVVSPEELVNALELQIPLAERAKHLIDLANANGGPDNITVILAEICQAEAQ
jgi:protein phosphatase